MWANIILVQIIFYALVLFILLITCSRSHILTFFGLFIVISMFLMALSNAFIFSSNLPIGESTITVTAEAQSFNVSVPTILSSYVQSNGTVLTATDATVSNNGYMMIDASCASKVAIISETENVISGTQRSFSYEIINDENLTGLLYSNVIFVISVK